MKELLKSLKIYNKRKSYEKIIFKYDKNSPAINNIGASENSLLKDGYKNYNPINKEDIEVLKNIKFNKSYVNLQSYEEAKIFNLIFKQIINDVVGYLGKNVKLDLIQVQHTKKIDATKNISGNWHTDNVGYRLKTYICIDGDGSQPTLLKKTSKNKIWRPSLLEDLRFAGIKYQNDSSDTISLYHKTGSIIMFDTNIKHRGGYNLSYKDRIVFVLEFSDFNKSKELNNLKNIPIPIGIQKEFNIIFGEDFLKNFRYKSFINPNLLN